MSFKRHISSAILLLLASQIAFAGAWNRDKKSGYVQFAYTYLNYDQLLNGGRTNIDLKRNIIDQTIQFYGEYGLSKKWNLLVDLPFKIVGSADQLNDVKNDPFIEDTLKSGMLTGISNPGIALKYLLYDKKFVLTAQLAYRVRNHMYDDPTGLQIGYDAHIFSPSILYGKGWSKSYFQAQAGFLLNTGKYAQNVYGNIEIGKELFKGKSYLIFRTDVKLPITEGSFNERNAVQTGLFRDNSSFISPGLKWIQDLGKGYYLNIAGYGAVFSEFEGAQATLNLGLAYEW